jgi:IS605 OrfB family transposase
VIKLEPRPYRAGRKAVTQPGASGSRCTAASYVGIGCPSRWHSPNAAVARQTGVYRNYDLRRHVYQAIKDDHRLGVQAAQLARRRRKEARHTANVNHRIAKTIVTEAARTGRGIAVENLTGIRDRVRLRKPQRVTLHSWSFHQLGAFLTYKARRAGVPLVQVDPRYTSQTCSRCGHRDNRNRSDQETFTCRSCGVVAHADHNAALNIAQRGVERWGAVNRQHAASPRSQRGREICKPGRSGSGS